MLPVQGSRGCLGCIIQKDGMQESRALHDFQTNTQLSGSGIEFGRRKGKVESLGIGHVEDGKIAPPVYDNKGFVFDDYDYDF